MRGHETAIGGGRTGHAWARLPRPASSDSHHPPVRRLRPGASSKDVAKDCSTSFAFARSSSRASWPPTASATHSATASTTSSFESASAQAGSGSRSGTAGRLRTRRAPARLERRLRTRHRPARRPRRGWGQSHAQTIGDAQPMTQPALARRNGSRRPLSVAPGADRSGCRSGCS